MQLMRRRRHVSCGGVIVELTMYRVEVDGEVGMS